MISTFKKFCSRISEVLAKCKPTENLAYLDSLVQGFAGLDIENRETLFLREQLEFLENSLGDKLDHLKDEKLATNVKDQIYRPMEMHLQKEKEISVEQPSVNEIEVQSKELRLSGSGLVEYLAKNVNSGESPKKRPVKISMDSIDQLGDFSKRNLEFDLNDMRLQAEVRKEIDIQFDSPIDQVKMDKDSYVTRSAHQSPRMKQRTTVTESSQKIPIKLNKRRTTFKKKKKDSHPIKVEEIDEILNGKSREFEEEERQEEKEEVIEEVKKKKKDRKKGGRSKSVKSVVKKKKKAKPKTEIKSVSPFNTGELNGNLEDAPVKTKAKSTAKKRKKTKNKKKKDVDDRSSSKKVKKVVKKKRKKKESITTKEWNNEEGNDFDMIRQTLYHNRGDKDTDDSPERRGNYNELIEKGEKEYKKKQTKNKSKSMKKEKGSSVVIKKKNLLNKSNPGVSVKKSVQTKKKSRKRRKTKTSDKIKQSDLSMTFTESGREIPKRNGRYDEEPETSALEEEENQVGIPMKKKFADSPRNSDEELEREYITFTSKLSKRKSKSIKARESHPDSKRIIRVKNKTSRKDEVNQEASTRERNPPSPLKEVPKSKSQKKKKSAVKKSKAKNLEMEEEEQPRKLTLKTKKKAKLLKKIKKEALANMDDDSEADIDEFEDSNFLKGKSLWGEELNQRVKSKSEVKLYRHKKGRKKGKSVKKSKQGLKKDNSIEGLLNYDTLPLKDDTLDKFAKLQKRSAMKKKKSRNNSLLSLRSAYSKKSKSKN